MKLRPYILAGVLTLALMGISNLLSAQSAQPVDGQGKIIIGNAQDAPTQSSREPVAAKLKAGESPETIALQTPEERSKAIEGGASLTIHELFGLDPALQKKILEKPASYNLQKQVLTEDDLRQLPATGILFAKAHPEIYTIH